MTTLPNIHPGEVLQEEFLIPFAVSHERLAEEIGVAVAEIAALCAGQRPVTADLALRLARFFGTTPGFWLGLQTDYDTEETEPMLAGALNRIRPFKPPVTELGQRL